MLALAFGAAPAGDCQVHERVAARTVRNHVVGYSISQSFILRDDPERLIRLISTLGLQYRYADILTVQLNFPAVSALDLAGFYPPRMFFDFGDPVFFTLLTLRPNGRILRFGGGYQFPLGKWMSQQEREYGILGGTGFHRLFFRGTYMGIHDPTIFSLQAEYSITLPRKERFDTSVELGEISGRVELIEVLNDIWGVSIHMTGTIRLPELINGVAVWPDDLISLFLGFSLLWQNLGSSGGALSLNRQVDEVHSTTDVTVTLFGEYPKGEVQ